MFGAIRPHHRGEQDGDRLALVASPCCPPGLSSQAEVSTGPKALDAKRSMRHEFQERFAFDSPSQDQQGADPEDGGIDHQVAHVTRPDALELQVEGGPDNAAGKDPQ